jgi:hypothetical protein
MRLLTIAVLSSGTLGPCLVGCDETAGSSERVPAAAQSQPTGESETARASPSSGFSGTDAPRSTYGKAYGASKGVVDRAEQQSQDLAEQFDQSSGGSDTEN